LYAENKAEPLKTLRLPVTVDCGYMQAALAPGKYYIYMDMSAYDGDGAYSITVYSLPVSGYEPEYDPEFWNGSNKNITNCYAYALNKVGNWRGNFYQYIPPIEANNPQLSMWDFTHPKLSPGDFAWDIWNDATKNQRYIEKVIYLNNVTEAISKLVQNCKDDALTFPNTGLFWGSEDDGHNLRYAKANKDQYKIAMVFDPGYDVYYFGANGDKLGYGARPRIPDYHFYRQNPDGTWSHKSGGMDVVNTDYNGNIIYDPLIADRRVYDVGTNTVINYTEFIDYFFINEFPHDYTSTSLEFERNLFNLSLTTPQITVKSFTIGSNYQIITANSLKNMTVSEIKGAYGQPSSSYGDVYILETYSLSNGDILAISHGFDSDLVYNASIVGIE
jgi:hypothetical protein